MRGKQVAGGASIMMPGQHPAWTTYIGVKSAGETAEKIKSAGGEVVMGPDEIQGSGHMAIFRDPTGAYLALWQPTGHNGSQIVQEPGSYTWTELLTRDLPRAKQFYKDVFGWDTLGMTMGAAAPEGHPRGRIHPVEAQWSGRRRRDGHAPHGPSQVPAYWQVYFSVENVDRTAEQIARLDGKTLVEPMDFPGGRLAVFSDPQGATFGIMHGA